MEGREGGGGREEKEGGKGREGKEGSRDGERRNREEGRRIDSE